MSPDELNLLLDSYRDGEISDGDAARLAAAVAAGGEVSARILAEIATAGLIAQALDPIDDEDFIRSLRERLRAESASDEFVRDFRDKHAAVHAGRETAEIVLPESNDKVDSRRGRRREQRRRPRHWLIGIAAVVALCAAVALVVWLRPFGGIPSTTTPESLVRLDRIFGEVFIVAGATRVPAQAGQSILAGQGLEVVGEDSFAAVLYADGTRLELFADTLLDELSPSSATDGKSATGTSAAGKRVVLSRGCLAANVAKQPPGRPMVVTTPHAEITVLGTAFSLSGAGEITYLETTHGNVRLTRTSDGRSIEVPADFDTVVGNRSDPLVVRPQPPRYDTPRFQWEQYWAAALSPDRRTLATTHYVGGEIELWNLREGSPLEQDAAERQRVASLKLHRGRVLAAAFAPDGNTLFSGGLDRTVLSWNAATGERRATSGRFAEQVNQLVVSPDGSALIVTSGEPTAAKTVSMLDSATLEPTRSALRFDARLLAVSPDGRLLATTSDATNDSNRAIAIHDLHSDEIQATLPAIAGSITCMAFSRQGELLAAASDSGLVTLWDAATGQRRGVLSGFRGKVRELAFSPDGKRLAAGHHLGMTIFDVATEQPLAIYAVPQGCNAVRSAAFSLDGTALVTVSIRPAAGEGPRNGIVQLWDVPALAQSEDTP